MMTCPLGSVLSFLRGARIHEYQKPRQGRVLNLAGRLATGARFAQLDPKYSNLSDGESNGGTMPTNRQDQKTQNPGGEPQESDKSNQPQNQANEPDESFGVQPRPSERPTGERPVSRRG